MVSVKLPKGRYIVAVSGGVDSMVLLDVLRRQKDVELIVAHVNHGIREDAGEDEKLVLTYSTSHNIKFVKKRLKLGPRASEESARKGRYDFLRRCRIRFKADCIVTAQHQDDLIETAAINLLRGTGWRGLAPFVATGDVLRPLVNYRKVDLTNYAKKHNVPWREDSTNTDTRYLRNYVRLSLLPRLEKADEKFREKLLRLVRKQQEIRPQLEALLDDVLGASANSCSRHNLIMLPAESAYEMLQQLLRRATGSSAIESLAKKILLFAKTGKPGKTMPITASWRVRLTARQMIVEPTTSVLS